MQAKITMEIDPSELYDETDLFMGLKAIEQGVIGVHRGLEQCLVRGEDGEPTAEIEGMLQKIARTIGEIERRILLGNLTVIRK